MSEIKELMDKVASKRTELKEVFESAEDGKYTSCLLYTSDAADE